MLEWIKNNYILILEITLLITFIAGSITLYMKYEEVLDLLKSLLELLKKLKEEQSLEMLKELQTVVKKMQAEIKKGKVNIRELKESVETLNTAVFDGTAESEIPLTMGNIVTQTGPVAGHNYSGYEDIIINIDILITYLQLVIVLIIIFYIIKLIGSK